MTRPRGYAVMTYARCGGTYFAQLLGSTGCLGRPEDWFNGIGYRNRGIADYPLDREGQLAMVLGQGRSENGVFGVKLSPVRCDELQGFDWAGRLGPLALIHLTRSDRLGMAISDVKTQQTGQFRSTSPPRGETRYDRTRILNALRGQLRDEARAREYFALNGIEPLEVSYEELLAGADRVVQRVARFLGVETPVATDPAQVTLEIQRDEANEAWRARFLAEHRDLGRMPASAHPSRLLAMFGR